MSLSSFVIQSMSVTCTGQARLIEQLFEKQEFETELSRRGFRHEEFALHVDAAKGAGASAGWNPRYDVEVRHVPTQTVRAYRGGPRRNWMSAFAKDLLAGLYGDPTVPLAPQAPEITRRGRRTA
jgi:hypothetical protein